MRLFVTGAAGFIGSNYVRHVLETTDDAITVFDALTYAGNRASLADLEDNPRFSFVHGDICDRAAVEAALPGHQAVVHFAAESHVDRSIADPDAFIRTNCDGTNILCDVAGRAEVERFLHISTDEVYGSIDEGSFTEEDSLAPRSPYSASKASSDHLVRSYFHTYGLPLTVTNCSNNYGPYQFPEKLIPLIILNALEGKDLPIYGNGKQIRDWLYVDDHARALLHVALTGKISETYNIGGHNELQNIDVVKTVCSILDELVPSKLDGITKYEQLITYVGDRAGHDVRYAIDATKIANELNWTPDETFTTGIKKTIQWYLENTTWCKHVQDGSYQRERLGNL